MTPSEVASIRAEALFASTMQESDAPCPAAVRAAVQATLRRYGTMGCALVVAEEFGDHPTEAVRRMAWVLRMLRVAYPYPNGRTGPDLPGRAGRSASGAPRSRSSSPAWSTTSPQAAVVSSSSRVRRGPASPR